MEKEGKNSSSFLGFMYSLYLMTLIRPVELSIYALVFSLNVASSFFEPYVEPAPLIVIPAPSFPLHTASDTQPASPHRYYSLWNVRISSRFPSQFNTMLIPIQQPSHISLPFA